MTSVIREHPVIRESGNPNTANLQICRSSPKPSLANLSPNRLLNDFSRPQKKHSHETLPCKSAPTPRRSCPKALDWPQSLIFPSNPHLQTLPNNLQICKSKPKPHFASCSPNRLLNEFSRPQKKHSHETLPCKSAPTPRRSCPKALDCFPQFTFQSGFSFKPSPANPPQQLADLQIQP